MHPTFSRRCLLAAAIVVAFASHVRAQTYAFTTVAGQAPNAYGSNPAGAADGAGHAARFDSPTGIAIDSSGNLFVADKNNVSDQL
jgi:hypothetical protein